MPTAHADRRPPQTTPRPPARPTTARPEADGRRPVRVGRARRHVAAVTVTATPVTDAHTDAAAADDRAPRPTDRGAGRDRARAVPNASSADTPRAHRDLTDVVATLPADRRRPSPRRSPLPDLPATRRAPRDRPDRATRELAHARRRDRARTRPPRARGCARAEPVPPPLHRPGPGPRPRRRRTSRRGDRGHCRTRRTPAAVGAARVGAHAARADTERHLHAAARVEAAGARPGRDARRDARRRVARVDPRRAPQLGADVPVTRSASSRPPRRRRRAHR